jgi:alkaline phosphatase
MRVFMDILSTPSEFPSMLKSSCLFGRLAIVLSYLVLTLSTGLAQEPVTAPPSTTQSTAPTADDTAAAERVGLDEAASDHLDPMRQMQAKAILDQTADWATWGNQLDKFSTWTSHSNRLVPVYTFGFTLDALRGEGSVYSDPKRLEALYGRVPEGTVDATAVYYDQTDIYRLQNMALDAGYNQIILMIFDGMDWQTTRAAALYNQPDRTYESGRGSGLSFLDDRRTQTDFGLICTSPRLAGGKADVNSQTVIGADAEPTGGYDPRLGGEAPWHENSQSDYLLGLSRERPHSVTDSASAATSMTSGIKTYNEAINVDVDGNQVLPIARRLQTDAEFRVGVVTSVPVSHATPAAAYANNVSRQDYQDLSRDMIGLPSSAHRDDPLPGVDVLIGAGWGETKKSASSQGDNFVPGNTYLHETDLARVDVENGGRYVVAQRTAGQPGRQVLMEAAHRAINENHRLLGFFGTVGGHLPFRTADGKYNPTYSVTGVETYSQQDVVENPTLAEATEAALMVLGKSSKGFWLMIEAGDVDWANHSNNLDDSIGAVLSGDEAFRVVMDWVDANAAWSRTAVIVTADHGHYLVIKDADAIRQAGRVAAGQ